MFNAENGMKSIKTKEAVVDAVEEIYEIYSGVKEVVDNAETAGYLETLGEALVADNTRLAIRAASELYNAYPLTIIPFDVHAGVLGHLCRSTCGQQVK
jgi:hypothetical protein